MKFFGFHWPLTIILGEFNNLITPWEWGWLIMYTHVILCQMTRCGSEVKHIYSHDRRSVSLCETVGNLKCVCVRPIVMRTLYWWGLRSRDHHVSLCPRAFHLPVNKQRWVTDGQLKLADTIVASSIRARVLDQLTAQCKDVIGVRKDEKELNKWTPSNRSDVTRGDKLLRTISPLVMAVKLTAHYVQLLVKHSNIAFSLCQSLLAWTFRFEVMLAWTDLDCTWFSNLSKSFYCERKPTLCCCSVCDAQADGCVGYVVKDWWWWIFGIQRIKCWISILTATVDDWSASIPEWHTNVLHFTPLHIPHCGWLQ